MVECKLCVGKGTKFLTGLMVMWIAIIVALWKHVKVFKLEEDLRILEEWFNGRNEFTIHHLEAWKSFHNCVNSMMIFRFFMNTKRKSLLHIHFLRELFSYMMELDDEVVYIVEFHGIVLVSDVSFNLCESTNPFMT